MSGSTYREGGVEYDAVVTPSAQGCEDCAFRLDDGCEERPCTPSERSDKQHVNFVKRAQPGIKGTTLDQIIHDELPNKTIYVIGSLRNERIPEVAAKLRAAGYDVFDDWYSAGPEADDYWKKYEEARGHDYYQALEGYAAQHVFAFDRSHLDRCGAAVLVLPAGRSGHLELGYVAGKGKPTFILHDNPDRWDVMYAFATAVVPDTESLLKSIGEHCV